MGTEYTLLITDKTLSVLGDPIANWTSLDATLRYREPSSGVVVVPGYPSVIEQIVPGARVVVNRLPDDGDGEVLIAGPIESWLHERSDDGDNAGDGKLTVHFADDLALIAAHRAYPNPANTPETQDLDNWTFTGNAEVAIRALIDANCGPGARSERRLGLEELVLGGVAGVGTSLTVTAERMEPLLDVARRISDQGGGLGFRTRQVGGQILFEVYQPPDKSGLIRFGFGLGNTKYLAYEVTAPNATAAIVGGQGDGADRFVLERINTDAAADWGRFETLVSRAGSGATADLQADGDKALTDGAATVRVQSDVVDTEDQQFGRDYGLGTRVSVESKPGESFTDIITMVHVQAWPTAGEIFAPMIGTQAATSDPAWVKRIRQLESQVARLSRNVLPSTP